MTYNEWRDELKSNLLCVSEQERVRVLDYYAEAYADRRDAGYSEQEITAEFGAPYDAAKRILSESVELPDEYNLPEENSKAQVNPEPRPKDDIGLQNNRAYQYDGATSEPSYEQYSSQQTQKKTGDKTWVYVLLCVILAVPIFCVFVTAVGLLIGIGATLVAFLLGGVVTIGAGFVELFADVTSGAVAIGLGLVMLGLGLILTPLFIKLIKLIWKLTVRFFPWLKRQLSGKEKE